MRTLREAHITKGENGYLLFRCPYCGVWNVGEGVITDKVVCRGCGFDFKVKR